MRRRRQPKAPRRRSQDCRSYIIRFLIVCEGQKTEPNYFRALVKHNSSDVLEMDVEGLGSSTCTLIRRAVELRERYERERFLRYDRVWVVFDKDDFIDFDEAIELAAEHGYGCAWSNEAFELWYYLHFRYLDAPIGRYDYITRIEREVRERTHNRGYRYQKRSPKTFYIVNKHGSQELAMASARRLREYFADSGLPYREWKPCTTIDQLVTELENPELVHLLP